MTMTTYFLLQRWRERLLRSLETLPSFASAAWHQVRQVVTLGAAGSRPLMWLAGGSFALLIASLVMQLVDPRQLLGVPLWMKPAKFAASIALTAFTLALLLRHIGLTVRARRLTVAFIVGFAVLELAIITIQTARGVPSHFNAATRLDSLLFTTMGIGIVSFTLAIGYIAVASFRQQFADRALGWGIRLGCVAMLFGSSIAFLMPRPTPAQAASLRAGAPTPLLGAHSVGVPDGGPGLPVTGWSARGGDLRIPHFIGLHGLQILPLVGWLLGRRRKHQKHSALAVRLTAIAGGGYLGLTVTTLVEALRARPLFAPDMVTAMVGLAVLAAGTLAVIAAAAITPSNDRAADPLPDRLLPQANTWKSL
jgi:uncharacterized membrane protein YhdT